MTRSSAHVCTQQVNKTSTRNKHQRLINCRISPTASLKLCKRGKRNLGQSVDRVDVVGSVLYEHDSLFILCTHSCIKKHSALCESSLLEQGAFWLVHACLGNSNDCPPEKADDIFSRLILESCDLQAQETFQSVLGEDGPLAGFLQAHLSLEPASTVSKPSVPGRAERRGLEEPRTKRGKSHAGAKDQEQQSFGRGENLMFAARARISEPEEESVALEHVQGQKLRRWAGRSFACGADARLVDVLARAETEKELHGQVRQQNALVDKKVINRFVIRGPEVLLCRCLG